MRAEQARQIPIALYLERAGIKPAHTKKQGRELWYSSPIRSGDSSPSFKVDTVLNLWFDHGAARGGNVIDLVIEMRQVTVKEALAILASGFGGSTPASRPIGLKTVAGEKENDRSFMVLSVEAIGHPALLQYVDGRRIPRRLSARWLKEIRFRSPHSNKQYFAVGFPSGDGWDVRSTVFKGFAGKGKGITTINFTDQGTVAVFEGAFDFLSWLASRDLAEPDCGVIILHSVAFRRRALDAINAHGFGRVMLYLDNDEAGHATVEFFSSELGHRNVVDRSASYRPHKDVSDRWMHDQARRGSIPGRDA